LNVVPLLTIVFTHLFANWYLSDFTVLTILPA
jgi:hypothetical protein